MPFVNWKILWKKLFLSNMQCVEICWMENGGEWSAICCAERVQSPKIDQLRVSFNWTHSVKHRNGMESKTAEKIKLNRMAKAWCVCVSTATMILSLTLRQMNAIKASFFLLRFRFVNERANTHEKRETRLYARRNTQPVNLPCHSHVSSKN